MAFRSLSRTLASASRLPWRHLAACDATLDSFHIAALHVGTHAAARDVLSRPVLPLLFLPTSPHHWYSSGIVTLPPIPNDPAAERALRLLMAVPWQELNPALTASVSKGINRSSDPEVKAILRSALSSAEAVAHFSETLENIRLCLEDMIGGKFGGERVVAAPEKVTAALEAAFERYSRYVASFTDPSEDWLKRKVQYELGGQMLLVKQRCSGLDPKWGEISLLGTSGMSGSFIEKLSK